jgi:protease-4
MAFDRDPPPRRSLPLRIVLGFWTLLTAVRSAVVNLLFLALLGALLWAWLRPGAPPLQDRTALVLDLAGPITEQRAGDPRGRALGALQGRQPEGMRLRDVVAVVDAAAADPKITHMLLRLDELGPAGLPTLREVAAALQRFKAAGKPIYAWGNGYDQRSLYLAAQADTVWMHPMGMAIAEGFGRQRNYYRDALEKIGVQATVVSAGTYKSFGEVYGRSGPSEAATEAEKYVYDALWARWTGDFEAARQLPAGSVMALIDNVPARLAEAGGSMAQTALTAKWVDGLKTYDEVRAFMIDKGARDDQARPAARARPDVDTFRQVSFSEYLARQAAPGGRERPGNAVGIVVAEGEISAGDAPPGSIGGTSTAALVRQARVDPSVKAIVLRVNSPGGSAFGSELVRRELELARAEGKPVLVSMGSLAASGGYWISMAADEIWADETTITGSIGVVGLVPSIKGTMDRLGIQTGGYGTTWLVGVLDPRQAVDPRVLAMMQNAIGHSYQMFLDTVAAGRNRVPQEIDAVAQGRIWTGAQARERGLVDHLGGLRETVAAAAQRAGLPADAPVRYIEREPGRLQLLLERLGREETRWAGALLAVLNPDPLPALLPGAPQAVVDEVRRDLGWLRSAAETLDRGKPFETAVHCLCSAP